MIDNILDQIPELDIYFELRQNLKSQLKDMILKKVIGEDTPTPLKTKHDHCAFCGELNTHNVNCVVQIENDLKSTQRTKLNELFEGKK